MSNPNQKYAYERPPPAYEQTNTRGNRSRNSRPFGRGRGRAQNLGFDADSKSLIQLLRQQMDGLGNADTSVLRNDVTKAPANKTGKPTVASKAKESSSDIFIIDHINGLLPVNSYLVMNRDHCGFVPLVRASYDSFVSQDSRFGRRMPFNVFLHVMNECLWIHILGQGSRDSLQRLITESEVRDAFLADKVFLPAEIAAYIRSIGRFNTTDGDEIRPGMPGIAIPGEARLHNGNHVSGGDFGLPDEDSHNAYECYVAPVCTARSIRASATHLNPPLTWAPLPPELMPAGLVPTGDFLGWTEATELWGQDSKLRFQAIQWDTSSLGSRLQHSSTLWNAVMLECSNFADKRRIEEYVPTTQAGDPAATGFVRNTINDQTPLSLARVEIVCERAMTAPETGCLFLFSHRRRREVEHPGCCFTQAGGPPPADWVLTRNHNFQGIGDFNTTYAIITTRWNGRRWTICPDSDRAITLRDWIQSRFLISR